METSGIDRIKGRSYFSKHKKEIKNAFKKRKLGILIIVDMDLEKFFSKVNHDKLMQNLSNTIKDKDVPPIIRKFLVSISNSKWSIINYNRMNTTKKMQDDNATNQTV